MCMLLYYTFHFQMCLFCREMVDIEHFLRETAEKEAEAKSRLQVKQRSSVPACFTASFWFLGY